MALFIELASTKVGVDMASDTQSFDRQTEQNSSQRLSWLDVLKGIGIILVAMYHVYDNSIFYTWMHSFLMPLFFFAAGWLYKKKPVWTDIKRRIQTIVIPYFSFGVLILIYWFSIERRFRDSSMGLIDSFIGLLLGEYDLLDFNVHLWFLPCYFVTVVISNILVNIGGKKLLYIVAAVMSVVYVISSLKIIPSVPVLPWGIDRMFEYIGFYAVGTFLADRRIDEYIRKKKLLVKIASCLILIAVNFVLSYFLPDIGIMWYVIAMVGVMAVLVISIAVDQIRVLQHCGQISLLILCIHGPVYRIVAKLLSVLLSVSVESVRSSLISAILIVAITLIICCIIYEFIIRTLPWMLGKQCVKMSNG